MAEQLQFNSGQHLLNTWCMPVDTAYMLLTDKKGMCHPYIKGKAARRALRVYQIWVAQSQPCFWPEEACGSFFEVRRKHILEVVAFSTHPHFRLEMKTGTRKQKCQ